mmetsp:Transcript_29985/g.72751  ORF Transcript_29985/g.72751 Transcript_29985/m.72751 type:complete len:188 (-) Transcript_29985:321-884(-)|eukprot:CAMPEP_0113480504 /NCGR_PEP_ID=MMETSP0014_2-20120614/21912_1 /TAXON_ID=2857 /ORGANISM="Nitzschia sp." /LENGTH=187 /DNA_ID=CAMNT_0000373941 /DNA_START=17 /DNA_END=580 /DNA_ORIENTATION=+ /assembly_acc=CAM_ASM_000159
MTSAIEFNSPDPAAASPLALPAEEPQEEEGEQQHGLEEGLLDNNDDDNDNNNNERLVIHRIIRKIVISALVFAIAQGCIFFIPAWLSKHSTYCSGTEFFCPAAVNALLILFITALITSGLTCIWTVKAWRTMPSWTRIVGLLPIVTFALVLVTSFIYSNTHKPNHPYCVPGEDGCPQTAPPQKFSFI